MTDLDRYAPFWRRLCRGVLVVDEVAETTVAGCALASHAAAVDAVRRLEGSDFYDGRLWEVIRAACTLGPVTDEADAWAEALDCRDVALVVHGARTRITLVAQRTGLAQAWLRQLVLGRCVDADRSGWFAERVAAAAVARARVRPALDALAGLGVDVSVLHSEDPTPIVSSLLVSAAAQIGREVASGDYEGAEAAIAVLGEVLEVLGIDAAEARQAIATAYYQGGRQHG